MSWWDIKWWRAFIVLPLSEKIGFENVLRLSLSEAFGIREAISDRNEFEEYAYWFSDLKREKEDKPKNDGQMKLLRPAEKDHRIVNQAMQSADDYFMFLNSRGFNGGRTTIKNT